MAEFISTGLGGLSVRPTTQRKAVIGKSSDRAGTRSYEREELMPPPRPPRNFVPTQEVIDSLIDRALAALARGMYWDRGSIINLVL
jgi:hypothetical protein